MRRSVPALIALLAATTGFTPVAPPAAPPATPREVAEAAYARYLQLYADRTPELAIAMTSSDFTMVNNQTVMDRASALAFVQGLAQFILSRQCTHSTVSGRDLPQKGFLLLSRVDCQFETAIGPLEGHILETITVDHRGQITWDSFSDVANPSLP